MYRFRTIPLAVALLGAGALTLGGCATEDYVNKHVATVDQKVTDTQGRVDAHETHLGQLDKTTQDALDRATAAGKLAEGKFLYSMVLSDDSVASGDSLELSTGNFTESSDRTME